ncbi:MAG: hypothetical protein QOD77_2114 [Thermoplasmata archaeon]|jgi:hypothetical protein|nr:hypothetical protein [Thermoplasmata archaeon]
MSGVRAAVGLVLVAVAILALAAVLPALRPPPQDALSEAYEEDAWFDPAESDYRPEDLQDLGGALDEIPSGPLEDLEEQLGEMDPEDLEELAEAAQQLDPEQVEDLASLLEQAAAGDQEALEDAGLSDAAIAALQEAMAALDPEQQQALLETVAGLDSRAMTELLQDADALAGVDLQDLQESLAALRDGTADPAFAQAVALAGIGLGAMAPWPQEVGAGALGDLPQNPCPPAGDAVCGGRLATVRVGVAGANLTFTGPVQGTTWVMGEMAPHAVREEVLLLSDGRAVVPTLGPMDVLVSVSARDSWGYARLDFRQMEDGSVEAYGQGSLVVVELGLRTDLDYGIAVVPAGTPRHPSPPLQDPALREAGLAIAALAGLDGADPVATQLNGLQAMLRGFGPTAATDPPATLDALLAAARAHEGCAATRAVLFVAAAEALGTPARVVRLQAGVSAEAELAGVGWRRMDLRGCGAPPPAVPEGPGLVLHDAPQALEPGAPFTVAGTTAPHTNVQVYLEQQGPARAVCEATSGKSGQFYAMCQAPADLALGAATLRARAGEPATGTSTVEAPVLVSTPAALFVDTAPRALAGNPTQVRVTLRDLRDEPIAGQDVAVWVGGAFADLVRTGPDGTATLTTSCPEPGTTVIEAEGAGAAGSTTLECQPATLQAQVRTGAAGTAITGSYTGNGSVAIAVGKGKPVVVPLANGSFAFTPKAPPGPAVANVTAADGSRTTLEWTERATVAAWLRVPPQVEAGVPVPLDIMVDTALPTATVRVVVDGALWNVVPWTGEPVEGPALAPGDHTFALTVLGDWQPAAPLAANTTAGSHRVVWDAPPLAIRGQDLTLAGTLLFEGKPAAGPVAAGLGAGMIEAEADPDGRFALTIPALRSNGTSATLLVESEPRLWRAEAQVPLRDAPAVALDAPGLAFVGFDDTLAIEATGGPDSRVRVTIDGKPLRGVNGTHRASLSNWFVSVVTIEAVASPVEGNLAPVSETRTVLLVNPWTTGLLLAVAAGVVLALVIRNRLQRRPVIELEDAGPQAVRLLHPALPRHVPWVFDPNLDGTLRFQSPGAIARVEAGGVEAPFEAHGAELHVPLAGLPAGRSTVRFLDADGRNVAEAELEVAPLHSHLDATMRGVASQLRGRPRDGPVPVREFRRLLARSGVPARQADQVQSAFERTLFSGAPCDRPAFHACYAALGAAKEAQA